MADYLGKKIKFNIEDNDLQKIRFNKVYGESHQVTRSGKNFLENTGVSNTSNGVTFTINDDKTILVDGNNDGTANSRFIINNYSLKAGTYILNGCPSGGSSTTYRLAIQKTSGWSILALDTGSGSKQFTIDEATNIQVAIFIQKGQTVSNLLFKPMIRLSSIIDDTYEQYGVMPSPDYPSPIESITEISATVTGKNLFDKDNATTQVGYFRPDGAINNGGDSTITTSYTSILPNTDMTISGLTLEWICFYDKNKNFIERVSGTLKTFNRNAYYIRIQAPTNVFDLSKIQLEKGQATDYEQYKSNSLTIDLQGNELCSLPNGTKDELVVENGIAKIIKRIGKVVLDGSEDNLSDFGTYCFKLSNFPNGYDANQNVIHQMYCNYFISQKQSDVFNGVAQGIGILGATTNSLYISKPKNITTVAQFKEWLSTHNTEVYYALVTPIDIEITDPTLLAQLNALEQITQYKHTYITITGDDLIPEADFTYINNVVINNTDSVLGKDTYWNDEVPTQQDLPSNAQEGEIRIVQDTEDVYIYNGTKWVPFDKNSEVDLSNYLTKDNTTPWVPTGPFNPSTKKYVDDSVGGIHVPTKTSQLQNDSGFVIKTTNELTNYYTKNNTYTKNEVDALVASGGGTSELAAIKLTGTEENPIILNTLSPGFYHINEFYKYKESSSDVNWTDGKPIIVLVHKKYYSSASGNYSDNFSKILFTDDYSEDFPNRDILSIYTISDSQSGEYAKESLGSGDSIERELATFEGDGSTTTFTYHLQGAPSYLQTFFIPQVQFYYIEDTSTMIMKPVLADYNVNPSTGIIEINLDFIMPESTGLAMIVTY